MNLYLQGILIALYLILLAQIFRISAWRWVPCFTLYLIAALIDTVKFFPTLDESWWRSWWVPYRPVLHVLLWSMTIEAYWRVAREVRMRLLARFALLGMALCFSVVDVAALWGLQHGENGLYAVAAWRTYSITALFVFASTITMYLWFGPLETWRAKGMRHLWLVLIWCGIHAAANVIAWRTRGDSEEWRFNTEFWSVVLAGCLLVWLSSNQLDQKDERERKSEVLRYRGHEMQDWP